MAPYLEPPTRRRRAPSSRRAAHREPPVSASDYVTRELRARILDGLLPSSTHLDQQILADEMGVSTIPVREGLRRLEASGLVEIVPRRGAFVAGLSSKELLEISQIRQQLEELAIRTAAPNVDSTLLDQLADANDRMARLTPRAKPSQWFDMNREWHFRLYQAADSDLLIEMIGVLWDKSSLYRLSNAAREENRVQAVAEHAALIDALRSHDTAAAVRAIRHHIHRAARDMLKPSGAGPAHDR
jgi:DNA-binding GntR family transcriptional regulator